MLLCDHIVFWGRHFQRPQFTEKELGDYLKAGSDRMLLACKIATAKMLHSYRRGGFVK